MILHAGKLNAIIFLKAFFNKDLFLVFKNKLSLNHDKKKFVLITLFMKGNSI